MGETPAYGVTEFGRAVHRVDPERIGLVRLWALCGAEIMSTLVAAETICLKCEALARPSQRPSIGRPAGSGRK